MQINGIMPRREVELERTPFFAQEANQCGPASLAMILGASGIKIHPDDLAMQTYLPGRRGSLQLELIAACRTYGRVPYEISPDLSALIDELQAGRPVLVLQNLSLQSLPVYHYAVVIGVRPEGKIILRSGSRRRLEMDAAQFLMSWKRPGAWGMIALRPGELPAQPDPLHYLKAVNAFETKGNIMQAEKCYQAAITVWPENQAFLFALGNNYLLQEENSKAEGLFREVLTINPHHVAAANNLAETFVRKECYAQAAAVIEQAVQTAERLNSPLQEHVLQTRQEILQRLQETDKAPVISPLNSAQTISEIHCP
jgi:tetratricopeptide (TPR) repeat protein